ncbi:MAG: prolyl oligopeptidase family serine peptidase [Kistimonas sp.]|nr:prolyl oligopeptidase family serine peptidase [Kistimonas sp.]
MPDSVSRVFYAFRHTLDYAVASTHDRLVWIDYIQGEYELYTQDLPAGPRRKLMTNAADEGQVLQLVQLSRSGRLVVVRSGRCTQEGSASLTSHQRSSPDLRMLLIDTEEGRVLQSIKGASTAVVTPDESSFVWVRRGTVLACSPGARRVRKQFTVRGRVVSLHWSPEGGRLAFVCHRGGHRLIGIYTPGQARLHWVAPEFDSDDFPCWSPDSSRLAFIRFHGPEMDTGEYAFSGKGERFSVMVAVVATGETLPLWPRDREPDAGFSRQYGHRPLLWLDAERLLFSHDNCGWDHLYQLRLADGSCEALTRGSWLVQDYCGSQDGSEVVFSHNRLRRHHYSLDRLTTHDGKCYPLCVPKGQQYWQPCLSCNCRYLVFLSGDESRPCHLGFMDQLTGVISRLTVPDLYIQKQAVDFVTPVTTAIQSGDRLPLWAHLFVPQGEQSCPGLVSVHCGDGRQSLPGFHREFDMSLRYALCQLLVRHGFFVMDINCRGQSGYGKLFRQAPERGWAGASDYLDVRAAGHWLRQQVRVASHAIGVLGQFWGGGLCSLALARDSHLFRAGVVIGGCSSLAHEQERKYWRHNMFDLCNLFDSRLVDSGEEQTDRSEEEPSAWGWLKNWMSPVLLVHGDDSYISFAETQQLAHQLVQRSVEVESLVLPDEGHSFLLHKSHVQIGDRILEFLLKHLGHAFAPR